MLSGKQLLIQDMIMINTMHQMMYIISYQNAATIENDQLFVKTLVILPLIG
jgi:hypothetical protein